MVFLSRVFGKLSQVDNRDPQVQGPILWDLIRIIALPELFATLRKTKEGAIGPDKVLMRDLKNIDPRALLAHFNLWLYVGYQPADFRRSRTVLIPKTQKDRANLCPFLFPRLYVEHFVDYWPTDCLVFWNLLLVRERLLRETGSLITYFS